MRIALCSVLAVLPLSAWADEPPHDVCLRPGAIAVVDEVRIWVIFSR